MKKITYVSILCALFLGLSATAASAGGKVDKTALVGKWSGEVSVDFGGKAQKEQVKLEFKADGKVIATDKEGKPEEAKYQVKGDKVVFFDKDGKEEVHLVNVTLSKTALSGDMVPANKGDAPPGLKIKLALKRDK